MCGRFTLTMDGDGLLHAYGAVSGDDRLVTWEPVFSVSPRTVAPVVREHYDDEGGLKRTVELAEWGFHPAWAKDSGPRPINARFETVATNGMFRAAFTSSRAIVPMNGYYEWVETPDGKQPYFIHAPERGLLHAAGLTTAAKAGQDEDGQDLWSVSFTIITREARDASGDVHDRMPVFLTPDAAEEWITPGKLEPDRKSTLHDLLGAASEEVAHGLTTYPVDRKVNSTRRLDRRDPTLIEPIEL